MESPIVGVSPTLEHVILFLDKCCPLAFLNKPVPLIGLSERHILIIIHQVISLDQRGRPLGAVRHCVVLKIGVHCYWSSAGTL